MIPEHQHKFHVPVTVMQKLIADGCAIQSVFQWGYITYPVDSTGTRFQQSLCLFIPTGNAHDEVKMIWIESTDAAYHWSEGTYIEGEHSRCGFVGLQYPAPSYYEMQIYFIEKHKTFFYVNPYGDKEHWNLVNIGRTDVEDRMQRLDFDARSIFERIKYKTREEAYNDGFLYVMNRDKNKQANG